MFKSLLTLIFVSISLGLFGCSSKDNPTPEPESIEVIKKGELWTAARAIEFTSPTYTDQLSTQGYGYKLLASSICQYRGQGRLVSFKKAPVSKDATQLQFLYVVSPGQYFHTQYKPKSGIDFNSNQNEEASTLVFTSIRCHPKSSQAALKKVQDTGLDELDQQLDQLHQDHDQLPSKVIYLSQSQLGQALRALRVSLLANEIELEHYEQNKLNENQAGLIFKMKRLVWLQEHLRIQKNNHLWAEQMIENQRVLVQPVAASLVSDIQSAIIQTQRFESQNSLFSSQLTQLNLVLADAKQQDENNKTLTSPLQANLLQTLKQNITNSKAILKPSLLLQQQIIQLQSIIKDSQQQFINEKTLSQQVDPQQILALKRSLLKSARILSPSQALQDQIHDLNGNLADAKIQEENTRLLSQPASPAQLQELKSALNQSKQTNKDRQSSNLIAQIASLDTRITDLELQLQSYDWDKLLDQGTLVALTSATLFQVSDALQNGNTSLAEALLKGVLPAGAYITSGIELPNLELSQDANEGDPSTWGGWIQNKLNSIPLIGKYCSRFAEVCQTRPLDTAKTVGARTLQATLQTGTMILVAYDLGTDLTNLDLYSFAMKSAPIAIAWTSSATQYGKWLNRLTRLGYIGSTCYTAYTKALSYTQKVAPPQALVLNEQDALIELPSPPENGVCPADYSTLSTDTVPTKDSYMTRVWSHFDWTLGFGKLIRSIGYSK